MSVGEVSLPGQNGPLALRDARLPPRDHPKEWTERSGSRTFSAGEAMQKPVRPISTIPAALVAGLLLVPAAVPAAAIAQDKQVGVLEVSVDPAFPAAFGQELKLRVRVSNRGASAAKGVALDARAGAVPVGHVDVGPMGPGEQRTITLATRFKPAGAECLSIVPLVAVDSPVKAGPSRLACLTPGCYSLSERSAN